MFLGSEPTGTELVFFASAIGGSLFFIVKVMLSLVAGFGAEDTADGLDHDADFDGEHGEHDTEIAFKLLSLNSISAFFMMFGWTGLTFFVEYQAGLAISTLAAVAVGVATMVLTAWLFSLLAKFTSKGADFKLQDLIGCEAEVYQRIPAQGSGKVQISHNGLHRELDARSDSSADIESFTKVTITGLSGNSGVIVSIPSNSSTHTEN